MILFVRVRFGTEEARQTMAEITDPQANVGVAEYMSEPADGWLVGRQAQLAQDGYRQRLTIREQNVER